MSLSTSTSLLIGLTDRANEPAWNEFCSRYRPLVMAFARKLGLSEQDAQDLTQEVLLAFMKAYQQGKYDRQKGPLRTWLLGISRNKVLHLHRKRRREVHADQAEKTGFLEQLPDHNSISDLWEAQWREAVLQACLDQLRGQVGESTMQAFELLTLKEWPTERVAAHLQMTPNAVLKANRRLFSRLRQLQAVLEEEW